MAKHPLDLYQLFNLVVERGGLLEVRAHHEENMRFMVAC